MLSSVSFTSCVEAVTPPSAFEHKTVLICFQRFCQKRFFVIVDWNKKLLACDFQEYCSYHFLYKSTLTHFWGKNNADSTTHMQKWFHVGSCDTFQQSEDCSRSSKSSDWPSAFTNCKTFCLKVKVWLFLNVWMASVKMWTDMLKRTSTM